MYDQGGPLAEAFRRLRTRLMPVGQSGPRTIVVTSPLPGAGTTTVTCALGMALARGGARVVIVGADLHHPELDALVPVGPGAGLTEVLEHAEALDDALQPFGDGRLTVLPSGAAVSSPGDLLGSDTMALLVGNLQARFDRVLIEAPPVLPYADAVILAGATEAGVVLVVQHGKTRRQELGEAVGLLRESGVSILGLVLNMTPVAGQPTPATSRPASW